MTTFQERQKADMDRMLDETIARALQRELEMTQGGYLIDYGDGSVERVAGPIEKMAIDIQRARAAIARVEIVYPPVFVPRHSPLRPGWDDGFVRSDDSDDSDDSADWNRASPESTHTEERTMANSKVEDVLTELYDGIEFDDD